MNSKIIKCVAGAGKTTYSVEFLKNNPGGIYLAFTNSVVNDINECGLLSKTIDSFFVRYIIPKFTTIIPLIGSGSEIKYINTSSLSKPLQGVGNLTIDTNGKIHNRSADTEFSLDMPNAMLHKMGALKNGRLVQYIFGNNELRLTDQIRENLSDYIIDNYSSQLVDLINKRFSYLIIDEAQDLKGYRERFAKLLYKSNTIPLILLGDENQNINGGGSWFEQIEANEHRVTSFRCPENNCKWIRTNMGITIYGNNNDADVTVINMKDASNYDDGKRTLLYSSRSGSIKEVVDLWGGQKMTIKSAKGSTIGQDIVIVGKTLNKRNLYTAITRTEKNVYTTVGKDAISKDS